MVCTIVFSIFVIPVSAVASSAPTSSTPSVVFPFKPNFSLLPADIEVGNRFVYFSGNCYRVYVYPVGTVFVATPYGTDKHSITPTVDCTVYIYDIYSDRCVNWGSYYYDGSNDSKVNNGCFYSSDDDILNKDGTIFFHKPLPQTALVAGAGEALTPQTLLTSMIGLIRPLILLLIGLAGFWMCWHFLLKALRRV